MLVGQQLGPFLIEKELGAAGGGVWRSSDLTGATISWTPLTDAPASGAVDAGSVP